MNEEKCKYYTQAVVCFGSAHGEIAKSNPYNYCTLNNMPCDCYGDYSQCKIHDKQATWKISFINPKEN